MQENQVTKGALRRAWFIWETFVQTCYNYERMMGLACAHTFTPIVKCLYQNDPEKQKEMMKREILQRASGVRCLHPRYGDCA